MCFTGNQRSSNITEGDTAPQQPVTQYDTLKWRREKTREREIREKQKGEREWRELKKAEREKDINKQLGASKSLHSCYLGLT